MDEVSMLVWDDQFPSNEMCLKAQEIVLNHELAYQH